MTDDRPDGDRLEDDDSVHSAARAFQQIGNEFRIAILGELARRSEPVHFSELLDALDEPDSGRLNYHLNQLKGTYVAGEDGAYRLTIQGAKVVSSILASRYTEEDATYSVPVDGDCWVCGATDLLLEQVGQQAIVRCRECDRRQFRKSTSPAIWRHRDPEDVPAALDRVVWAELELAADGVCAYCQSAVTPRVAENRWESDLYGLYDFDVVAVFECELCTNWKLAPYGMLAWLHPEVRAFHREHGVDPDAVRCWQLDQARDVRFTTVVSEDPHEVEVRFPVGDDECRVTFDDRNEVVSVVREWSG